MDDRRRQQINAWMARVADGDRAAFDPLFAALWPPVRTLCHRALAGGGDADDAAQDAMIRVFERAAEFDRGRDAVTWVLAIAGWECRSARKRTARRRLEPAGLDAEVAAGGDGPDEVAIRRDLIAAAEEVLGALSPRDVETLAAAWSGDEVSRSSIAPATFRKRLERALGRFRAAWRSRHGIS